MKILLIRHGQDMDNARSILNGRRDTVLTKLGARQVRAAAKKLKKFGVKVIYTSPLKRTRQTAEIIAKVAGVNKIIVDKNLIERDFGILTGKPIADMHHYTNKIIVADKTEYFLNGDGVETFPVLYKRAKKFLATIRKHKLDDNILIVTHGDIGKMIIGAYYGIDWKKGLQTPQLDNAKVIELSNKPT